MKSLGNVSEKQTDWMPLLIDLLSKTLDRGQF